MKNVAIVDDEVDILNVLKRFLSKDSNYNIKTYNNPVSALSLIKNNPCDLILLDIMMPSMNGIEFLEKIKNSNPDIKVVMMTAFDTLERTLESHKKGANNYIKKPFASLTKVKEKIDKALA